MFFRKLTPHERIETIQVGKLQRLNCYGQLVKRLTGGESARSVARWAQAHRVEGPAGNWSEHEWRKHVTTLAKQVRQAKEKVLADTPRRRGSHLRPPPKPEAVAEQVDVQVAKMTFRDRIPQTAQRVHDHVQAAADEINCEYGLKMAWFFQLERLCEMREMEGRLKILMPNGDKTVYTMTQILVAMLKLEIAKKWSRGRLGEIPVLDANQPLSEIAQGMAQFDEVDRNLIREAFVTTLGIASEVSRGRSKDGGLATDARGPSGPQDEAPGTAAGPDVP